MRLSFGQLILLIICLLAALLLDFYLGARFGPEMLWGINLDRSANGLLPDDVSEQELNSLLQESSSKVTFHEVLEGKERAKEVFVEMKPETKPEIIPEIKPEAKPEAKLEKKPPSKPPPKPEPKVVIKPEVKPAPTPAPTPPVLPQETASYTLQVGSFSEIDSAQALQAQFKSQGYSATVKEVNLPEKGTWYRVYAGHFVSSESAEQAKNQVYQKFHTLPIVVRLTP